VTAKHVLCYAGKLSYNITPLDNLGSQPSLRGPSSFPAPSFPLFLRDCGAISSVYLPGSLEIASLESEPADDSVRAARCKFSKRLPTRLRPRRLSISEDLKIDHILSLGSLLPGSAGSSSILDSLQYCTALWLLPLVQLALMSYEYEPLFVPDNSDSKSNNKSTSTPDSNDEDVFKIRLAALQPRFFFSDELQVEMIVRPLRVSSLSVAQAVRS
jgi:hypothetical protein